MQFKYSNMLKHYLKIAWRNIRRNKAYSLLNISGIAIGLGAFCLIALYVADEFSYDRSFSNAHRIFRVVQHASGENGRMDIAVTSPLYATTFKNDFPEVEDAVRIGVEAGDVIHYADKTIKQDDICFAENSFFTLFDYHFLYGDRKTALKQPGSIVISEALASKIFGDAALAMNKALLFGSGKHPVKVTGVIQDMVQNSHLQYSGIRSFDDDDLASENWDDVYLYTYLLLKNDVDIKSLEEKLVPLEKDLARRMKFTNFQVELQPLTSIHLHSRLDYELSSNGSSSRVYMFMVIGLLVLLIAMINYMNLSTARAAIRVKEIGIRKVLGSGQKHLIGLFISEALIVSLLGAIFACLLVYLTLPFFNHLAGKNLGLWRFGVVNTLGFICLFTALTGILSGSYPAFFLSRFQMVPSLQGQLGDVRTSVVFRKSLVVFQFVITVCLLSGSYIIYHQMQFMLQKELGFDKEQVVIGHIDNMQVRNQIQSLKETLRQSPLIEDVATAGNPLGTNYLGKFGFHFEQNGAIQSTSHMANFLYTDEDFLPTNGMHLLQGRNFSKNMKTDKDEAIIINETLMKDLGYSDAIGKRIEYAIDDDSTVNRMVIGVVKDFHSTSLQHTIEPLVMLMPPQDKEGDNLYVRLSKGQTVAGMSFLKKTYQKFDPEYKTDFHFLDENFNNQYLAEQNQEKLTLAFTILALFISSLGLFGLVLFMATQRRKEISIRKVLGASVTSVVALLSRDFIRLVLIAIVIATPIAWYAMNRWLQGFAYRIELQWWMFALAGLTAIVVAMFTVAIQSVRVAMANPAEALQSE